MAANPEKGEVDLTVGDRAYVLRLTWNEIAVFERTQNIAWFEDFAPKLLAPNSIRGEEWIALLYSSLQRYHPEITLFEAGELLTEIGVEPAAGYLMECLNFTFPDPGSVKENPRKASPKSGAGKKRS